MGYPYDLGNHYMTLAKVYCAKTLLYDLVPWNPPIWAFQRTLSALSKL